MVCCQTNDNNANNANNFSYEKVSVSYDVVRTVLAPRKSLITSNWQTHFRSWSSYGTGRTGRHFSYKTHLSSYKKSATGPRPPSVFAMKTTRHSLPQFVLSEGPRQPAPFSYSCVAQGHAQFPHIPPHCVRYLYRLMR